LTVSRVRVLPLLAVLALAACGGGGNSAAKTAGTAVATVAGACRPASPPAATDRSEPKPTQPLDPAKVYDVTLQTNCGSFTIRLAVKTSPKTTASFVSLVRKKYFDGTVFHRIVPGFVIQGGDPTASGSGGPGYETVDRPPRSTRYTHGLVAMAKTASEPAGAAGSQFFVVTAGNAGLPADYAVLGTVVEGLGVVDAIGKLGDASEQPTETVEVVHATVTAH
jgi:peptidyl-prolyl cis-trans isomerase B (cyclophilin B)